MTIERPTPPRPQTATDAPAGTAAVLSTAPTPVATQQPTSAATSSGVPVGIGDGGVGSHDGRLGERADGEVGEDLRAVAAAQAGRAVRLAVAERAGTAAQPLPAGLAGAAAQAWEVPGEGDVLADPRRVHPRSDRLDHAGALVAEHDRRLARPLPVADVQVGVADPRRGDADADLAGARLLEQEVLDAEGVARTVEHGGAHGREYRAFAARRPAAPNAAAATGHRPVRRSRPGPPILPSRDLAIPPAGGDPGTRCPAAFLGTARRRLSLRDRRDAGADGGDLLHHPDVRRPALPGPPAVDGADAGAGRVRAGRQAHPALGRPTRGATSSCSSRPRAGRSTATGRRSSSGSSASPATPSSSWTARCSINGTLHRRAVPLRRTDGQPQPTEPTGGQSRWVIPDGEVFVMGDHREASADSRTFGSVPVSSVIGRAWLRYWPLDTFGILETPVYAEPTSVLPSVPDAALPGRRRSPAARCCTGPPETGGGSAVLGPPAPRGHRARPRAGPVTWTRPPPAARTRVGGASCHHSLVARAGRRRPSRVSARRAGRPDRARRPTESAPWGTPQEDAHDRAPGARRLRQPPWTRHPRHPWRSTGRASCLEPPDPTPAGAVTAMRARSERRRPDPSGGDALRREAVGSRPTASPGSAPPG